MSLEIKVKNNLGHSATLTQSQFILAHDVIVDMLNRKVKVQDANDKIIEICKANNNPIQFIEYGLELNINGRKC